MDKLIGTMLDNRYEVLEVIGTGGMATVYKAKCHRLNRYVAVKVMQEEYAEDEEFRRRFFEESQSVAMLSHPNIVNVYDVSRSGAIEYIVMELIDGITLKDYFAKRGALSANETVFFSLQIAKALEHAHSRDIIHRDIKPQNIMLLRDGTVKVADFGIAHHSDDQGSTKGEAIGSVHYVSPEQARGSRIDNRSDLYSFGVVMYEMLTGKLPFEGNTPIEVALQHIKSIPLPPSDYVEGIPQALEAITMKAMNPTPSKRYSSASEMITDLELFKKDPSVIIEFEFPTIIQQTNDVDSTKKLANPGEITETSPTNRFQRVDEDLEYSGDSATKSSMKTSIVATLVAVLLFVAGAVFFIFQVINPFGVGEEKLEVPDLLGKEYSLIEDDKNNEYEDFNIVVVESIYDETMANGFVLSQSPKGGKSTSKGATIEVVLSLGPKTVTVDDYVGMDGRSVLVILERLGLVPTAQYDYSDTIEAGLVIDTSPAKDMVLNSGDSILVRISKGAEVQMTTVPDLKGKSTEEAKTALETSKLILGTVTPIDSDDTPDKVIFQSLPANSTVEEGSVVDVQIARKKEVVEPPETKPDVTIQYVIEIDDIEGDIQIVVAVDSGVKYTSMHQSSEGSIIVELTAQEGSHTVTVFQNGRLTKEENVSFK